MADSSSGAVSGQLQRRKRAIGGWAVVVSSSWAAVAKEEAGEGSELTIGRSSTSFWLAKSKVGRWGDAD